MFFSKKEKLMRNKKLSFSAAVSTPEVSRETENTEVGNFSVRPISQNLTIGFAIFDSIKDAWVY